ncbi:unnamed protein product [Closterium sp. Yama58-4]|nr:unnamed protein product [Closterium sp. Yama58-4]
MTIVTAYLEAGFYVVYNNPGMSLQLPRQAVRDGKDLGDYEALQERFGNNPRLQMMQNLQKRWPELSFNEVQFRMLARSACFVSVRGEGSIVGSYFGGRNIVYFREGQEVKGKAYDRIYPQLSGAERRRALSAEARREYFGRGLMLAVIAASLTAKIFFSGSPLDCMVDPPLHADHPSGNESAVYSSANAPRTVPLRQFLLRRTAWGDGGNAAVAPWRIWGCYMAERRGDSARVGAELGMDRVVVRTTATAAGNLVGGSDEVEGEGAERMGLGDGVAAGGKGRLNGAASSESGEKGGETERRASHTSMEDGSGDANEGASAEKQVIDEGTAATTSADGEAVKETEANNEAAATPEAAAADGTTNAKAVEPARERSEPLTKTNAIHPPQPPIPPSQPELAQPSSQSQDGVDIFFQGEFGYELIAVLPFAYWHHLNGSLRSTTSCGRHSLASLYYFSPNHTDDATCHRSDMKDNVTAYGFPHGIHYSRIPPAWQPPPLAHYFRTLPSVWPEIPKGSRLVVIGNKYEREWGHSPVNFIDLPALLGIVESYLEVGFYVVYNNPGMSLESDHRQVIKDGTDLGDYEALQERFGENPRLQIMQNLQKRWPDLGFNDVQFRMLARSVCFVSVQGGGSIVESYFGGKNIIYFREGQEVKGKAYERIYPQLSGAKLKVVTSYEGLVRKVNGMIKKNKCHAKLH